MGSLTAEKCAESSVANVCKLHFLAIFRNNYHTVIVFKRGWSMQMVRSMLNLLSPTREIKPSGFWSEGHIWPLSPTVY